MKLCVISNHPQEFVDRIEKRFSIPRFRIHENGIDVINQIIKKEKEWIIETTFIQDLPVIANQATIIVLVKEKTPMSGILLCLREGLPLLSLSSEEKEFVNKYRGKVVILKNKMEINKFLIALEKDQKYWY